jgi:hypothetical protein
MSTPDTCRTLFESLQPLHELGQREADILDAAVELLCRARGCCSDLEGWEWPDNLGYQEWLVATAVVQSVWEPLPRAGFDAWSRLAGEERRRAMWLSAILRLCQSMASETPDDSWPQIVYIAWTESVIYVEVAVTRVSQDDLRASADTCALKALSNREVIVSSTGGRLPGAA